MSATITPIRGTDPQPPGNGPKAPRRTRKPRSDILKLRLLNGEESFDAVDIIRGLRGVCRALDEADIARDVDLAGDLAAAARVLSEMVAGRTEIEI